MTPKGFNNRINTEGKMKIHKAATRFGLKCSICKKPILSGDKYTFWGGKAKHLKCRGGKG